MPLLTPEIVFRQYTTIGVPDSGPHDPRKDEIVQLLNLLFGVSRGGWVVTKTRAELLSIAPAEATDGGVVLNDPSPGWNGYYQWDGAAWVRERGFPDGTAKLVVTGGNANLVQATTAAGIDPAQVQVYILQPDITNTGAVTLSVNGAAAKPLTSRDAAPLLAGEFIGGRLYLLIDAGTQYRLLEQPDLSGMLATVTELVSDATQLATPGDATVTAPKVTNDLASQNAILTKVGGVSTRAQALANAERAQIILNTGLAPAMAPQGRLSLIDGVAYPESNVAGGTAIYYLPVQGSYVPIWDGESFVARWFGDGLALALSNQGAFFNIDLYVTMIGGAPRLVTGRDWLGGGGSNTFRGTGPSSAELEMVNGILVNKYAQTGNYGPGQTTSMAARAGTLVGTFRPLVTGTAEDSDRNRLLSNVYNAVPRAMVGPEIYALTHVWSANSWHTVNGEADQKIAFLQSVAGRQVSARFALRVGSDGATARFADVGLGIDSNAFENATTRSQGTVSSTLPAFPTAEYRGVSSTGYHAIYALERGAGADVQTWTGNFGACRLTGECIN